MSNIMEVFKNCVIDKSSPMPVYYQIQTIIHNLIESKKLKMGDKIPTEEELCKIFNVSRMTIRQAIEGLVNSGELIREKGKGTFVASDKIIFELSALHSFSEDMKKRGLSVTNKIIETKIIKPPKEIANSLQITKDSSVFRLKRIRIVNRKPAAIEITYIPIERCPRIIDEDLENNSLFYLIENKYGLKLFYSDQTLEPVIAKKEESKLLQIKENSPLLKMTGITYLKNGYPIEYVVGLYRGDRYKFRLYLRRQ